MTILLSWHQQSCPGVVDMAQPGGMSLEQFRQQQMMQQQMFLQQQQMATMQAQQCGQLNHPMQMQQWQQQLAMQQQVFMQNQQLQLQQFQSSVQQQEPAKPRVSFAAVYMLILASRVQSAFGDVLRGESFGKARPEPEPAPAPTEQSDSFGLSPPSGIFPCDIER